MLILALVCGALLISGAIGLYFSYQENKVALASLQHEKALSAAARIEQFVLQIEQQLAYAALPQLGVEGLEQRRIEFLKLLRVVHAVTDITQIDAKGREQLSVSRLKMDEAGTDRDWSNEPAFKNARPGQTWYGPVYFRKETEPYMSIAVRSGGEAGAVTVAEVNLKFIWDVVTRIKVGQKGKAYVVDSTGHLVADPDIGLVLRKTDMAGLEQVKAALQPDSEDALAMLAKDLGGTSVLTAYAPIEPARDQPIQGPKPTPLGWKVFVEQPVSEVYQALDATVIRTVALLVAGLLFSALAAMWLARSMARPISVLQEGAQRIGAGDLDSQISIKTGDELESLADQFNRMTAQLRESYAGLERKVEERTAELQQALEFQSASGEILGSISSSIADTKPVFIAISRSLLRLFGARFAVVQLLHDGRIEIGAFHGEAGFERLAENYPRALDDSTAGGVVMRSGQVLQLTPVLGNPATPPSTVEFARTHGFDSLIAAPMLREDKVIGAIVAARRDTVPFDDKQVTLIKAFADQAVIAIENARLVNETKEALERQTAVADVLKTISQTTFDLQAVFNVVVENATKLCRGDFGYLFRRDGDVFRLVASSGGKPELVEYERTHPTAITSKTLVGRMALSRALVHIPDLFNDPDYEWPPNVEHGVHTVAAVPIFSGGEVVGGIGAARFNIEPFSPEELRLFETFADQAAIAIENVRLFNETKESLEQQTATADILKVISSSPSNTQPVFDSIVQCAARVFAPWKAILLMRDGDVIRRAARTLALDEAQESALEKAFPVPFDPQNGIAARAMAEARSIEVLDTEASGIPPRLAEIARISKYRAAVFVPLVQHGQGIGVIVLNHPVAGSKLTDKQLALIRTFADQAVIAIENVRLFNETKESLEQQTTTGKILRVIAGSPTDVQPVFDSIASSALRLFELDVGAVTVVLAREHKIELAALAAHTHMQASWRALYPLPLDMSSITGRTILEKKPQSMAAGAHFGAPELERNVDKRVKVQSVVGAPMIREGVGIGAIMLFRSTAGKFNEKQLALLRTFADQAAIAIENVRLFNETKESLEQQTAISEVLRVISSTPSDVKPVLDSVAERAIRLCDARAATIYVLEGKLLRRTAFRGPPELMPGETLAFTEESLTGRTIAEGKAIHVPDIEQEQDVYPRSWQFAQKIGSHTMLSVPLMREGKPFGTMFLRRLEVRPFNEKQIALASTFADQAAIAIENVRLFKEIQEKSRQLEIANKHKSDFLANMSHELRTPLNAIIGFSEVLIDKMFGELNAKQADYLHDIHESGRHLLSLINDILDLSKIEAGRMELEISNFHLPSTIANAMTLIRERAQRHGIKLGLDVDPRLEMFLADERKVKQILLNLLSNAVKFTPDGGRVDVVAKQDTTKIAIEVKDTGIGIAPEDHAAVFEEFKQVGRDYTRKAEGTGLGLALTKRFVELHGGEITLASSVGKGSTFTVTLPIRH